MGLVEDLSAAFVAFTIEVDDAVEARLAHRTTRGGDGRERAKGTWLVSLAMWENCMRWVPAEGIDVAELIATARTPTDLAGMRRWGYIEVEGWARAAGRPRPEAVVRPTRRGVEAQQVWDGVPAEVEARWAERFGDDQVAELRAALVALTGPPDAAHIGALQTPEYASRLDPGLPDTMPIVRHGWRTRRGDEPERRPGPVAVADLGLDSLLARPLTAFAVEFEASGKLSLAMHANLLTVLGAEPTPLRDLPDLTGIHREQIDNAVGYLERAGLGDVVPTPGAKRGKAVALTATGTRAKTSGERKLVASEATWDERHGPTPERVRKALTSLVGSGGSAGASHSGTDGGVQTSPLLAGLVHPPGTWRAAAKPLARLPRFPLVTHRGGFPDGA